MNTTIYILHGVFSKSENLRCLSEALKGINDSKTVDINDEVYDWTRPIVDSGLALATYIMEQRKENKIDNYVVLVGHSQGGLVCRVAAVALKGELRRDAKQEEFGAAADLVNAIKTWRDKDPGKDVNIRNGLKLLGVALLATPNCGALTNGQLTLLVRIAYHKIVNPLLKNLFKMKNFPDLTSDKLFRALQFFEYSNEKVPYLSISGSAINRYSSIHHGDLNEIRGLGRLAPYLKKPNDSLVEDCSVDLNQAPLPSEVTNGEYEHCRQYKNCTDVWHTDIHKNAQVHEILKCKIEQWIERKPTRKQSDMVKRYNEQILEQTEKNKEQLKKGGPCTLG